MSKYFFFWGGFCSQWHESPFTYLGVNYRTAEHFMMAGKARVFNDYEMWSKIMDTPDPRKAKQYGREIEGFDFNTWMEVAFKIVVVGNRLKFGQSKALRQTLGYLYELHPKGFVEASPYDKIWGTGIGANEVGYSDPVNWKGENLLGKAITLVAESFRHNPLFRSRAVQTVLDYENEVAEIFGKKMKP